VSYESSQYNALCRAVEIALMPEDFRDREERRAPRGTLIDEFGRIRNNRPPN